MRRKCNLDIILKKSKFFSQVIVSHLITEACLLGHQGPSVLHPTKNLEQEQEIELLPCDLNIFWGYGTIGIAYLMILTCFGDLELLPCDFYMFWGNKIIVM